MRTNTVLICLSCLHAISFMYDLLILHCTRTLAPEKKKKLNAFKPNEPVSCYGFLEPSHSISCKEFRFFSRGYSHLELISLIRESWRTK